MPTNRPNRRSSRAVPRQDELPTTPAALSRLTASWAGGLPVDVVTGLVPKHGATRTVCRWMQAAGPGLRLSVLSRVHRGKVVAQVDVSVPNPGGTAGTMLDGLRADVEHLLRHVPLRIARFSRARTPRKAPVVLSVLPRDSGFVLAAELEERAQRVTNLFGTLQKLTEEGSVRGVQIVFEAHPLPDAILRPLRARASRVDRAESLPPFLRRHEESHTDTVERLAGAFRVELRVELQRPMGLAERTTLLCALETHLGVPVAFGDGPFLVDGDMAEMLLSCHLAALADRKAGIEPDPRPPGSGRGRPRARPTADVD